MTQRSGCTALAALLLVACSGGPPKTDSATATPTTVAAATTPSGATAPNGTGAPNRPNVSTAPGGGTIDAKGCLHDGRWRACGFADRLERSGLVVHQQPDTAHYDFISVPGVRYSLGRGDAEAFFYDDTTRLARDLAGIDTTRVAPKGTYRHWDVPPTLVHSANLLVLVLSANDHLVERVQLAVEAGAPQPEPPPTAQTLPPVRMKP